MAGNLGVTAADIITEALSILGVYAQSETLDAGDQASALFTFNGILDGWGAEPLTIYNVTRVQYPTVPNQTAYTLGPDTANDWVTTGPLPAQILRAGYVNGVTEWPINLRTLDEYAVLGQKTFPAAFVSDLYISYGATAHTVNPWPIPTNALQLELYLGNQVPKLTNAANVILLPPGYQEALTFELALKNAAKFDRSIPQFLPEAWADAKHKIKARNFQAFEARCDPALQSHSQIGGGWPGFWRGR